MALAAPYCDYTPDCFWTPEDGEEYRMAWRLHRDRQRYQLIDTGWKIRYGIWSHEGRRQYFRDEEPALKLEAADPTHPHLHMPKRIYTGIDLYVFNKIGRHPTGIDQLLFGQWSMAAREIEYEYVRRYGCCGETSEAAEHGGLCKRFSKPARVVFLEHNKLETFVGECDGEEKRNRAHDFYSLCEMCPRLLAERLVRKMTDLITFDNAIEEARLAMVNAKGILGRSIATANALKVVGALVEENIAVFMALQGSQEGYEVDRAYTPDIVKSSMVVGLINGFMPVNFEMGIICHKFYGKAAGYKRKILEHPGVSNFKEALGVPAVADGGKTALVAGYITCDINGTPFRREFVKREDIDLRIPVRVNDQMGPDAVLGKARRKAYKAAYEEIAGIKIDDPDTDERQDEADAKTVEGTAIPSAQQQPAITSHGDQLKQHQIAWLESSKAGMEQAANLHDINAIVDVSNRKKPELRARIEEMAAPYRAKFGSTAGKREPAGAGVS